MSSLPSILQTSAWIPLIVCVLVQVTVLSAVCCLAIRLIPGRYSVHDVIGRTGLFLILVSPIFAAMLPAHWKIGMRPFKDTVANAAVDPRQETDLPDRASQTVPADDTSVPIVRQDSKSIDAAIEKLLGAEQAAATETIFSPDVAVGNTFTSPAQAALATRDVASKESVWRRLVPLMLVMLVGVWITGVMVILLRSSAHAWHVQRLVRNLDAADLSRSALTRLARQVGLGSVPRIVCCSSLPTPCILGRIRPVVAIPSELLGAGFREQRDDALLHEFAHLARKDHWLAVVQWICDAVFWPHPVVRWLNQHVSRTCEELCDNRVLAVRTPAGYADSLLRLSLGMASPAPLGVLNRHRPLEARIADLLSSERDRRTACPFGLRVGVIGMLVIIVVGIGGVAQWGSDAAAMQADESQGNSGDPVLDAGLQESVTVAGTVKSFDDDPLQQATVRLFRFHNRVDPVEILQTADLNRDGTFEFESVRVGKRDSGDLGLGIAVAAKDRASEIKHFYFLNGRLDHLGDLNIVLLPAANIVGVVTDPDGKPLRNASIGFPSVSASVPGVLSATTDANGKFMIPDLSAWDGGRNRRNFLSVDHPNHATISWPIEKVPSVLRIQMKPSAVVTGRVIDTVTGKGVSDVIVSAQGIRSARQASPVSWHETRTDEDGRYRIRMLPGRYNLWADVPGRVSLALETTIAEASEYGNQEILVVKGSVVKGSVAFGEGERIPQGLRVAVHGPSRPPSGAAVSTTIVKPDGTFQIRVAPGKNYLYLMNGAASTFVEATDGETTSALLIAGVRVDPMEHAAFKQSNATDVSLLMERRRIEQTLTRLGNQPGPDFVKDQLKRLAELNGRKTVFKDVWLLTMKSIVDVGEPAVPVLIDALEEAEDNAMLRCLPFMLRALGDQRAIAPLIRAYPKTRFYHGSDMGCFTEQEDLGVFARKHDLDKDNDNGRGNFGVGRPLREFIGALQTLTGQDMNDLQLNSVASGGTPTQEALQHNLYAKKANQWVTWYNKTLAGKPGHTAIAEHAVVPVPATEIGLDDGLVPERSITNGILSPFGMPKRFSRTFLDLDTQRVGNLPERLMASANRQFPNDEIDRWAREEGYDLMCMEITTESGRPCYVLRTLDAESHQLPVKYWDGNVNGVTRRQLIGESRKSGEQLIPELEGKQYPFGHSPFLVQTNLGTVVIVKVGVEIRFGPNQKRNETNDHELRHSGFFEGRRIGQQLLELSPNQR